jgi:hypothetical protein
MDRRFFTKTLGALGASVALPSIALAYVLVEDKNFLQYFYSQIQEIEKKRDKCGLVFYMIEEDGEQHSMIKQTVVLYGSSIKAESMLLEHLRRLENTHSFLQYVGYKGNLPRFVLLT